MKRFSIFAVCVLVLQLCAAAFAQNPQGQPVPRQRGGPGREKRLKRMDINNDGAISRDEWKGRLQVFDGIDKNGDGSLTREELIAAEPRQPRKHGRVNQMDTNNDNQISREEWKGEPKRFDRLDVNSDGVITKEELRSIRRNRPNPQGN
jgi:Ca2+-binding EF-hand superfamily protein